MARVMSDLGVLLVAPDGAGHTWSFPGSPGHYRDEFAFVRAVLDDVEARFPIDKRRLWASGFSQGGSMVWYAACFLGDRFAAFVPVAGDFWEPPPPELPLGTGVDPAYSRPCRRDLPDPGRAVAERAHQGDLWQGWALWLRTDGCAAPPDRVDTVGDMTCQTWAAQSCSSGRELALCLHDGGHVFNAEWLREAYGWVAGARLRGDCTTIRACDAERAPPLDERQATELVADWSQSYQLLSPRSWGAWWPERVEEGYRNCRAERLGSRPYR